MRTPPMFRALLPALAVATLAACATTPEKDPVAIKMNDLDRRLERLERVLSNQSLPRAVAAVAEPSERNARAAR